MKQITFTIDGHLPSRANQRGHWRKWAGVWKAQRTAAFEHTVTALMTHEAHELPLVVTLTRVSARYLDDDNLATAFKSTRDGIADALGLDDRDPRIRWEYAQEKGKPPYMRIQIERDAT